MLRFLPLDIAYNWYFQIVKLPLIYASEVIVQKWRKFWQKKLDIRIAVINSSKEDYTKKLER